MSLGVHEADDGRGQDGGLDPEEFARRVRCFAFDTRRALNRPDCPIDEVVELHRRAWFLLREAPGAPASPLHRWIVAAREAIDAKLRGWALEELESLVA